MSLNKEISKVLQSMSEEDRSYAINNQFAYIYSKAYLFLKMGMDLYFRHDFFLIRKSFTYNNEDLLEVLQSGCKQIVEGRGFSANNPLVDLDVFGFSDLMRLFHFSKGARKSNALTHNGENGILDQITFEHFMEEKRIATLFNFVTYPHKDNK